MKTLRIVSDLHLEFYKNDDFKLEVSPAEDNTILLLAGDIAIASKIKRFKYFFEDISNRFHTILYVLGNHEYYRSSIMMSPIKIKDLINQFNNIHLLENETFEIDNIIFICATLWSDFNNDDPLCKFDAKVKMNDYKIIRHGPKSTPWKYKFSPNDAYVIHKTSRKFIFDSLKTKNENKKYVVMTHMGPSYNSVPLEYKHDLLNGAYVSNLDDDILKYEPDLMVHGHTHTSFDYMIGKTRIICNPYGYTKIDENPNFEQFKLVEL